ncbi:MAG: putative manganese transporter, partial [Prevotellaceae bacterium]|nr:putative manganese transporter [Prevotellaceae bacterium]
MSLTVSPHAIVEVLQNAALITGLVMTMLLLIEYINVCTATRSLSRLRRSRLLQVAVAALLGLLPGCMGGMAVVSLFTHGVLRFGALLAGMVASVGDEAFAMYALFPLKALQLQGLLLAIALAAGYAA